MKNEITLALLILSSLTFSQVNPHTIGLRLNGFDTHYGGEVSYQHRFGDANRLELSFGFRNHKQYSNFAIAGIYHWV